MRFSISGGRRTLLAAVVGTVAIAAAACTGGDTSVTVSTPPQTGVSVTGTGKVTVTPDIGQISLGVEVTLKTVAQARSSAAETLTAIIDTLKANGVADEDIRTQFFNIRPQFNFQRDDAPEIIGFTVTNTLDIKVREIDDLSKVLDDAIEAGGNFVRVNNVSFGVDEPEQYLDEARKLAVEDARARAKQLVELAGAELGDVRSISEGFGGGPPSPLLRLEVASFDSSGAQASPLSPGQQEITLTVNVTFDIK